MNRLRILSLLVIIVALTGCAATRSNYPVLVQEQDGDSDLSCRLLNTEFQMASNLLAEILDAHGADISSAVKSTAIKAVTDPVGALIGGVMKSASISSATKHYAQASVAAGKRMEQILRYKRERGCPTTPSRDPSLNDDNVLTLLDEALSRFKVGDITDQEYLAERTKLLNKLTGLRF